MDIWGPATFQDELACDWLEDLYDSDPLAFFIHCLDLRGLTQLDHLACVGVLCTAEMIHGVLVGPRRKLPDVAAVWIENNKPLAPLLKPLVVDALAGLQRVRSAGSTLYERWQDEGQRFDQWQSLVAQLQSQLSAVSPTH